MINHRAHCMDGCLCVYLAVMPFLMKKKSNCGQPNLMITTSQYKRSNYDATIAWNDGTRSMDVLAKASNDNVRP